MKKLVSLLAATLVIVTLGACANNKNENVQKDSKAKESANIMEINVSAAASLKDALEEINKQFESQTGNKIVMNLGASGKLVKQIEQGAPADVFISASKKNMKQLIDQQLVDEKDASDLLENDLVMIVPQNSKEKIEKINDLEKVNGKIAVGEVESVPAGQYAKESLVNLKLWDKIQDKIVMAKDVRATLSYVEKGEVVAGFVYSSDAKISKDVKVCEVVDKNAHKPIVYPISVIKQSKNMEQAKKYVDFLKTEDSKKIFEKYGFKAEK